MAKQDCMKPPVDRASHLAKFKIDLYESETHDAYYGSAAGIVAAGVVPADKMISKGERVTYFRGEIFTGNFRNRRKDETYLRLHRFEGSDAVWVDIGLSSEVAAARKVEFNARRQANAKVQEQKAPPLPSVPQLREFLADDYRDHLLAKLDFLWLDATQKVPGRALMPFHIDARSAERLFDTLRDVALILKRCTITRVGVEAAALEAARQDVTFQSFMLDQGLRGHAAQ